MVLHRSTFQPQWKTLPQQRPWSYTKQGFLGENQAWTHRGQSRAAQIPPILEAQVEQMEEYSPLKDVKQAVILKSGACTGVGARTRGGQFYLPE